MMYLGNDPVGLATSIPTFGDIAKIECGVYTPESDTSLTDNPVYIDHNLGVTPDFFIIQSLDIAITDTYQKKYLLYCILLKSAIDKGIIVSRCIDAGQISYPNNHAYTSISNLSAVFNEHNCRIVGHGSDTYLKANTPYYYILGKYKEVTSNANE